MQLFGRFNPRFSRFQSQIQVKLDNKQHPNYLETVAALGLLPHHVQDAVHELGPLGVVTLGPVVAGAGLSEHEVVGSEDLTEGPRPHAVHGPGLQVHQHGPGHVLAAAGLVVVDIDPLQLEVRVSMVCASGVNAVLIGDDFPKLKKEKISILRCFGFNKSIQRILRVRDG